MITSADLKKLVNAGSGPRIEILAPASATADRLAAAMTSLANADGGIALVPTRVTRGSPPDLQALMDRAMQAMLAIQPRLIAPMPYFVMEPPPAGEPSSPLALAIEVPQGLPNVYSVEGRYLTRKGHRIVDVPARQLRDLMLARSETNWESQTPTGATIEDLDWQKVEAYVRGMAHLGEATAEDVLMRRGCLIKQGRRLRPTHAGVLLFGKQPQRWVRGAEILCARFSGVEMNDAFTRQTISGTLPDQIARAEAFLHDNMAQRSRISAWKRADEAPYPPGVLREAVVNAVAHRDYRLTGNQIHVLMFGDRVEVRSPGKLPGHVTLKNLLRERYSRNEAIVQALADLGFIERLGYGIDRMVRAMKERDQQPPAFEESEAGFGVTLFARQTAKDEPAAAPAVIPSTAQQTRMEKMLSFIKEHGRITNREYQELCPDVSAESLRRDFVDLVERGAILRVGDKRGTYYILK
jgi:ATP-dependent DNA helicase RecG